MHQPNLPRPSFNSNHTYEAPIGSKAARAAFKDAWTLSDINVYEHGELADRNPAAYAVIEAARLAHGKPMQAYLIFMAVRLLEMQRVLKPSGSIYLHCDPTANHYLKLLMDGIFGLGNFRNEIVWSYAGNSKPKTQFPRKHDILLLYSKTENNCFHPIVLPYKDSTLKRYNHTDKDGRRYKISALRDGKQEKIYMSKGVYCTDVFLDIPIVRSKKERTGYPTQKPLALLERILKASSNEGDWVLDPFCGCATTLVMADRLGCNWAGIDFSALTIKWVNERIAADRGSLWGGATALEEPPQRTDLGKLPNYRIHKHHLYSKQEGVCVGCAMQFLFKIMEVDHILPQSRGGTDHLDNLQLLCNPCNRSKGRRTPAEWKATFGPG